MIGPRTRIWITALAWSLWALPANSQSFEASNSEAIKQMRAGQTEQAEKLWSQLITSPDVKPEQKKEAMNNLAVLYHKTGNTAAAVALESKICPPPPAPVLAIKPPTPIRKTESFTPLPIVTNRAANRIKDKLKTTIINSLENRGLTILNVSQGNIFKLPKPHHAIITFDVKVSSKATLQTVYCYNFTVEDQGDGEIKILDKQCTTGRIEMTDAFKTQILNAEVATRESQEAERSDSTQQYEALRAEQARKEADAVDAQNLADLHARQKQNARSGYMTRYSH